MRRDDSHTTYNVVSVYGGNMGSQKSTSNREDWSDFSEDGLVGELKKRGFDSTFPGGLKLIPVKIVDLELSHKVRPS